MWHRSLWAPQCGVFSLSSTPVAVYNLYGMNADGGAIDGGDITGHSLSPVCGLAH